MLKVIDRHILSLLVRIFSIALASLLLIFLSLLVLRYSTLISDNNQVLSAVVWTCIVGLPMHVSYFIPVAVAVAAFYTIKKMHQDSSLLGALSLGYKSSSLQKQFILFGAICAIITMVFTIWLGPLSARAYYTRLNILQADRLFLYTEPKTFVRLTSQSTIWIENKTSDSTMENIILDIKSKNGEMLMVAQYARVLRTEKGVMLEARDGTIWRKDGKQRQVINFEKFLYGFESLLAPKKAWVRRLQKLWTRDEVPSAMLFQRVAQAGSKKSTQKEKEIGYLSRRELLLRFAYPLLPLIFVGLVLAICLKLPLRSMARWRGPLVFVAITVYSTAHVSAVAFSSQGGIATILVFLISGIVFAGSLLLATIR